MGKQLIGSHPESFVTGLFSHVLAAGGILFLDAENSISPLRQKEPTPKYDHQVGIRVVGIRNREQHLLQDERFSGGHSEGGGVI